MTIIDEFVEEELTMREVHTSLRSLSLSIESNSEFEDKVLQNIQRVYKMLLEISQDLIQEVYEPASLSDSKD